MNSIHVKRGDTVLVLAGKDKGKKGRILAVNPKKHRVQVENVNIIMRHKKAKSAQESGGRIEDAGYIDSSNVMAICPDCSMTTRIAHREIEGKKVRVCKHCNASLDGQKLEKKVKKKDTKKDANKKSEASKDKKDLLKKSENKKTTKKEKETDVKE